MALKSVTQMTFYKTQLHPFGVLLVDLLHQSKHPKDKMETLQQCLTKAL